eukprot:Rmarinus@m.28896
MTTVIQGVAQDVDAWIKEFGLPTYFSDVFRTHELDSVALLCDLTEQEIEEELVIHPADAPALFDAIDETLRRSRVGSIDVEVVDLSQMGGRAVRSPEKETVKPTIAENNPLRDRGWYLDTNHRPSDGGRASTRKPALETRHRDPGALPRVPQPLLRGHPYPVKDTGDEELNVDGDAFVDADIPRELPHNSVLKGSEDFNGSSGRATVQIEREDPLDQRESGTRNRSTPNATATESHVSEEDSWDHPAVHIQKMRRNQSKGVPSRVGGSESVIKRSVRFSPDVSVKFMSPTKPGERGSSTSRSRTKPGFVAKARHRSLPAPMPTVKARPEHPLKPSIRRRDLPTGVGSNTRESLDPPRNMGAATVNRDVNLQSNVDVGSKYAPGEKAGVSYSLSQETSSPVLKTKPHPTLSDQSQRSKSPSGYLEADHRIAPEASGGRLEEGVLGEDVGENYKTLPEVERSAGDLRSEGCDPSNRIDDGHVRGGGSDINSSDEYNPGKEINDGGKYSEIRRELGDGFDSHEGVISDPDSQMVDLRQIEADAAKLAAASHVVVSPREAASVEISKARERNAKSSTGSPAKPAVTKPEQAVTKAEVQSAVGETKKKQQGTPDSPIQKITKRLSGFHARVVREALSQARSRSERRSAAEAVTAAGGVRQQAMDQAYETLRQRKARAQMRRALRKEAKAIAAAAAEEDAGPSVVHGVGHVPSGATRVSADSVHGYGGSGSGLANGDGDETMFGEFMSDHARRIGSRSSTHTPLPTDSSIYGASRPASRLLSLDAASQILSYMGVGSPEGEGERVGAPRIADVFPVLNLPTSARRGGCEGTEDVAAVGGFQCPDKSRQPVVPIPDQYWHAAASHRKKAALRFRERASSLAAHSHSDSDNNGDKSLTGGSKLLTGGKRDNSAKSKSHSARMYRAPPVQEAVVGGSMVAGGHGSG